MNDQMTIDDVMTDADDPARGDFVFDHLSAGDCGESDAPDLIDAGPAAMEDQFDIASPARFPTISRMWRDADVEPVSAWDAFVGFTTSPAFVAGAISLVVHVNIALLVYCVMHRHHVFVAAHSQQVQGDGAASLGRIDHDGNDEAPGAVGPASLTPGWAAPPLPGGSMHTLDPLTPDAGDPSPPVASAPPFSLPDPSDEDAIPAPVLNHVSVSAAELDPLPRFSRSLPEARDIQPQKAIHARPALPAVASTQSFGTTTDPPASAGASPQGKGPNVDKASAGGFASPESDNPGGLLHQGGAGGPSGKGGAVTGAGGNAITGRPGAPRGVKGQAIHAEYPDYCKRHGETGRVVIAVDVLADGSIASLTVVSDAGHPLLARAALDALRGRQFYPALLDGQPVRSTLKYPFVFELR